MSVNTMTFEQAGAFLMALYKEVTGQESTIKVVDSKSYTSVGTTLVQGSLDPVMQGMIQLLDKTIFAMRVYNKKFDDIIMDERLYGAVTQKVNFLDNDLDASDERLPLTDGTSLDPWKIKKVKVVAEFFYGNTVYQDSITIWRDQLNSALRNADEGARFFASVMTNIANKQSILNPV